MHSKTAEIVKDWPQKKNGRAKKGKERETMMQKTSSFIKHYMCAPLTISVCCYPYQPLFFDRTLFEKELGWVLDNKAINEILSKYMFSKGKCTTITKQCHLSFITVNLTL